LPDADLEGAILRGAKLIDADHGRTRLRGADLAGAILCRATLANAVTDGMLFEGARYGSTTSFPPGFDPKARGGIEDPCCAQPDVAKACASAAAPDPA
jgi:hypothetical protein